MISSENEKKLMIKNLKREYRISDDSVIPVGSNYIFGHFSLLNRHKEGNEDRIAKIKAMIQENESSDRIAYEYKIPFPKLMEIYDVNKKTDLRSLNEILRVNLYNRQVINNGMTCELPNIRALVKPMGNQPYLEINGEYYSLMPGGQYRIGRLHNNAICIDNSTVSRKHCEVSFLDGKAAIRDLGSRNGTYVNGIKINGKKNINIGDKITIGAVSGYLKQNQ